MRKLLSSKIIQLRGLMTEPRPHAELTDEQITGCIGQVVTLVDSLGMGYAKSGLFSCEGGPNVTRFCKDRKPQTVSQKYV